MTGISIPISWLIKKWWWPKDVKTNQLKKYGMDWGGFQVHFEIDDEHDTNLATFIFTEGPYLRQVWLLFLV